jgi:hypothetical protein
MTNSAGFVQLHRVARQRVDGGKHHAPVAAGWAAEDFRVQKIGAAHQRAAQRRRQGDAVEQPGKTRLRMAAAV